MPRSLSAGCMVSSTMHPINQIVVDPVIYWVLWGGTLPTKAKSLGFYLFVKNLIKFIHTVWIAKIRGYQTICRVWAKINTLKLSVVENFRFNTTKSFLSTTQIGVCILPLTPFGVVTRFPDFFCARGPYPSLNGLCRLNTVGVQANSTSRAPASICSGQD